MLRLGSVVQMVCLCKERLFSPLKKREGRRSVPELTTWVLIKNYLYGAVLAAPFLFATEYI
jgi:hypothetical protein